MPNKSTKPVDQQPEPDNINDELLKLHEEVIALKTGWQRTQADFENFRRRMSQEQHERSAVDVANALSAIAPVAENLRRAIADIESKNEEKTDQMTAWLTGIGQVARQLDQALANAGLTPIDPKPGEPFNPHEHEALTHQPHADHSQDSVTQVIERGYKVGNRVLNPAKVVVSSGPPVAPEK